MTQRTSRHVSFTRSRWRKQEDRNIELPEELTEKEATRLGILMSEMSQPPPMPQYTLDLMPTCLSKEDALNLAL
jgi:hypothetical protein